MRFFKYELTDSKNPQVGFVLNYPKLGFSYFLEGPRNTEMRHFEEHVCQILLAVKDQEHFEDVPKKKYMQHCLQIEYQVMEKDFSHIDKLVERIEEEEKEEAEFQDADDGSSSREEQKLVDRI